MRAWTVLVPVVALGAGLLFGVSARTARGTDLRSPAATADLAGTVRAAAGTVTALDASVAALQARIDAQTATAGGDDARVAAVRSQLDALQSPFGATAVSGAGLTVTLDDAPSSAAGLLPPGDQAGLDQLVVHQSDLQAVVNALWVGGAQAVAVAGQRLVPTSAVRCVGNTLLLNGRVYSPPYRVAAVGPSGSMRNALDDSAGVSALRQAVRYYGVGYAVTSGADVQVPAYEAPVAVSYAVPGS